MPRTTLTLTARDRFPLERPFKVLERILRNLESPGGRILVLLVLAVTGYVCAAFKIPHAEQLGASSLIALLLVLARNPRSPGFWGGALLSLLKRPSG
jgi:hypothetical protein